MNMTWRWFGNGNDNVKLSDIRQIPGINGIVWSLHNKAAGEIWPIDEIRQVTDEIKSYGFHAEVVESVNIHDDIKIGLPSRDHYIDIYIDTIRKLASVGVKVICYNFMPVFDWLRTDFYKPLNDFSNAMFYEKNLVDVDIEVLVKRILEKADTFTLPGWEPERLSKIQDLLTLYKDVSEEKLTENLKYFLGRIIPACEECDVRMAIHPDDPPWPLFGLPRIIRSQEHIRKFLKLVDSPYNGLTLCTGSLGASAENDIPSMIREYGHRIHFAHIRNLKRFDNGDYIETSHRSEDGSLDIYEIVKAFHDIGFSGYVRPDHGRHLWGEEKICRPGYGMYDRALGAMYLTGLWEALEKGRVKCSN